MTIERIPWSDEVRYECCPDCGAQYLFRAMVARIMLNGGVGGGIRTHQWCYKCGWSSDPWREDKRDAGAELRKL